MRSVDQNESAHPWINGTSQWMYEWVCRDWRLYYVNIMFEPMRGPPPALIPQMRRGIHKFYGRFCTKFVHHGRAKSEKERLPKLWLFPDLPVQKHENKSLREITINGGLHFNGPMLLPPFSRFKECPIKHIEANQNAYTRHGINRIHIMAGGDIPGLADYAAKTIKNYRGKEEDIIVLPRLVKELPAKKKEVFDPRERLIKDIQSRFSVSDEIARETGDKVIKSV